MNKIKSIITIALCAAVLLGLSLFAWIKAPGGYSNAERRTLAQLPKLSYSTFTSGKFMSDFDNYSMDQFPMRDGFRSFKAVVSKYAFGRKDNHGLYSVDGVLSKLEYPVNEKRVSNAVKKINEIEDVYLKDTDCKVYLSVIPDKNYFLAPLGGYPAMDYDSLVETVREGVPDAQYIDIFDLLSLDDYYKTDQHWRQEKILDVAERVTEAMAEGPDTRPGNEGVNSADEPGKESVTDKRSEAAYEEKILDYPFYGAYVGQSALPFEPDEIHFLTNETLENCIVTSYNTGAAQEAYMYDMSKAYGRDPYEMFLSGSDPLIVVENPNADTDRELIIFRDSFGSSLVPLMAGNYAKITVVDLRYIKSSLLSQYITFDDQDVLFMYSTLILNNNIAN